jgi:hypothetical protein
MIKVCMLGAVDRFNYGDLLLPIIVKEKLKSYDKMGEIAIFNYGIINSDLSKFGALPSMSLSDFYSDCRKNNTSVIIVGGEVLNAEWGNIYSYINPSFNKIYKLVNVLFRRYGMKVNSNIAKQLLSGQTYRPFILDKKKLKISGNLIYNGVGGARNTAVTVKEINNVRLLASSNVDYISVRDEGIYSKLVNASTKCFLTPDSAILMSTIFLKNDFNGLTSLKNDFIFNEDFIFFQISKRELELFTPKKIADSLENFYKKYSYRIVLCPIGTALGHEDHIALGTISALLDPSVLKTFIEAPSIWDIMFLISKSKLYIGSSLHGVITAMSYTVPYLAIRESTKIKFYLKTWAPSELNKIASFEKIEMQIENAFKVSKEKLDDSREKQIEISEQSMLDIFNILING